ncbi:hypothetical protein [Leifsonia sp. RAF41]|uniref:hypothetical protein n=1 Tax=Leifsonia sp. RAF41 TaxID=3233056 RepID=UPI003F97F9BD
MSNVSHLLRYDGQEFPLTAEDHRRLRRVYETGLAVSGVLFDFVPAGSTHSVTIAVGSGAAFVLTEVDDVTEPATSAGGF